MNGKLSFMWIWGWTSDRDYQFRWSQIGNLLHNQSQDSWLGQSKNRQTSLSGCDYAVRLWSVVLYRSLMIQPISLGMLATKCKPPTSSAQKLWLPARMKFTFGSRHFSTVICSSAGYFLICQRLKTYLSKIPRGGTTELRANIYQPTCGVGRSLRWFFLD